MNCMNCPGSQPRRLVNNVLVHAVFFCKEAVHPKEPTGNEIPLSTTGETSDRSGDEWRIGKDSGHQRHWHPKYPAEAV